MQAKTAPDRIVPQQDDDTTRTRFAPKKGAAIILTAQCLACGGMMRYNAITRRFTCVWPSCEASYPLREIERPTIGTHCPRCGHIMALHPEDDIFLCSNPRCPRQVGLRNLMNDITIQQEIEAGRDGVPPKRRGTVYILHYKEPIGARRVRHYVGWCRYLPARIAAHLAGKGSKLTRAFFRLNIRFSIGFASPGTPSYERKIKRQRHTARFCAVCQAEHAAQQAADQPDELL